MTLFFRSGRSEGIRVRRNSLGVASVLDENLRTFGLQTVGDEKVRLVYNLYKRLIMKRFLP